jgi:hypothetical protein
MLLEIVLRIFLEVAEIQSVAERVSLPAKDDNLHTGVLLGAGEGTGELGDHLGIQGVLPLRSSHRDGANALIDAEFQAGEVHGGVGRRRQSTKNRPENQWKSAIPGARKIPSDGTRRTGQWDRSSNPYAS